MVLDIIIVALIVIGAFIGYRKGLVGILVSLIGTIAAIILAFLLQTPVANSLYNGGIGQMVETTVQETITNALEENLQKNEGNADTQSFYSKIIENVTGSEQVENVSKELTMSVLKGISFFVIFFVVILITYILQMILNIVVKLPLVGVANNVGGILAGALKVIVKVYVILAIVYCLSGVIKIDFVDNLINSSTITKLMYNNNVIVSVIFKGVKI